MTSWKFWKKDRCAAEERLSKPVFAIDSAFRAETVESEALNYAAGAPFPHTVIDDFLPAEHARFLGARFPRPDHPIWLDWRKRSPHQYGKQGVGDTRRFDLLEPEFRFALQEFNASAFLGYVARVTGLPKLLPDPYFTGGGLHQIVDGGILDVHTDFNAYTRLDLVRRVNLLIYLTEEWCEGYGGELELWDDAPKRGGRCVHSVAPLFNRAVIFQTNKASFHGHPNEWRGPEGNPRRSIALYYYLAKIEDTGEQVDRLTDFQGVASKPVASDD